MWIFKFEKLKELRDFINIILDYAILNPDKNIEYIPNIYWDHNKYFVVELMERKII